MIFTNLPAAGPWIPVTERMPEEHTVVLVHRANGSGPALATRDSIGWLYVVGHRAPTAITHWAAITPPGAAPQRTAEQEQALQELVDWLLEDRPAPFLPTCCESEDES